MARILIVDDQPFNVDLLEQELEALEYETDTAFDGQEALERVEAEPPDLILLDVMMPVLDGFSVCEILKADPTTALIPIIIMTALDDVDDRIRGIEAGADDFLTKPVNERELKARIETALRLRAAMQSKITDAGKAGKHYEKFVPEIVKRRVEENPDQPELEKREEDASILFLDIVGYTRLSERMSPSELSDLVERYFSVFIDHIHAFGGDIAESSGDGLMVLFQDEDPVRHAQLAVEAGRVILEETDRLNAESSDLPIALHMGVNSGLAHVGSTRYEGKTGTRWVFTADGFVVNLAARLASVAEAGELVLAPETVERLRDVWEFEDLGAKAMKNVAEPTHVYRIIGPRQEPETPSLVVLPIDNADGDAEHRLVCDGLAEDLIADFGRIEGLLVIAPGSASAFRPTDSPADICNELRVDYALLGSLSHAETGVRIESRLVSADGELVWDDSLRFELESLFDARDRVLRGVVDTIGLTLTEDDEYRLQKRSRAKVVAWKHYQRALKSHREYSRDSNALAIRRLDMALNEAPDYSRALAMKSRSQMLYFMNEWGQDPQEALQSALELAREAIAADSEEALAYASLAAVLMWMRRHEDALQAAKWAIQREPNHAPAYITLASIHHYRGEHEEGLEQARYALRLDPKASSLTLHFLAQCQYGTGRYEEAAVTLNRRLSINSNSDVSRVLLAACYGQLGEKARAREQWDEALAINPLYSLEQKRETLPYQHVEDFDHMVDGLAKAGIEVPAATS